MSDSRNEPPVLHVHGQRFPHDPVEIFGTTSGVEVLINALIEAINEGRGHCAFIAADGTKGEARIACLDGPRRDVEWLRSGSPYLDVEDPLVARILDLTEENVRLRRIVHTLKGNLNAGAREG